MLLGAPDADEFIVRSNARRGPPIKKDIGSRPWSIGARGELTVYQYSDPTGSLGRVFLLYAPGQWHSIALKVKPPVEPSI